MYDIVAVKTEREERKVPSSTRYMRENGVKDSITL